MKAVLKTLNSFYFKEKINKSIKKLKLKNKVTKLKNFLLQLQNNGDLAKRRLSTKQLA